jgi:hypothetical protein
VTPQLPIHRPQPRVAELDGMALALGGSGVWRDGVALPLVVSAWPRPALFRGLKRLLVDRFLNNGKLPSW